MVDGREGTGVCPNSRVFVKQSQLRMPILPQQKRPSYPYKNARHPSKLKSLLPQTNPKFCRALSNDTYEIAAPISSKVNSQVLNLPIQKIVPINISRSEII